MFTPMGNKKYLLQKKWGLEGSPPPKTRHQSLDFSNYGSIPESNSDRKGGSIKSGSISGKMSSKETGVSIASSANLEKALAHVGTLGVVMNKVLESTVRYRPDKDAVVLKVFQSKHIDYDIFRNALYSTFWLQFNDEEYQVLLDYFDPQHNGVVNGYDFMIAFIRLGGIRKNRMSIEVREKQELFMKQQKEEEERKKLEKEKKHELAANFNFSDEVRQRAHQKLLESAIAFDASHPSAPSLEGFHVTTMKPYTFRELIKLTFNLKVDRDELGAILTAYDAEINETNSNINASGFLKYFLRLGIDGRHKEKQAQRHRQASMTEAALEEQAKKAKAAAEKMLMTVDYNFTPSDELNATTKLRDASTKYDKAAPGAVALDGFECESLNPGQFRDIMRQVFNIVLTNCELGFLVQKYDLKKIGSVHCKTFLTDFFRLGQEQRHKLFIEQLDRQRTAIKEAHQKHLKKMHEVQNSAKLDIDHEFSESDLQSAMDKLTHAAIRYDKTRGASMISFEGSHLTPLEFARAIKRTFNLKLTPPELGAVVHYFDNDDSGRVTCASFLTTFTTLGAAEKYKIRAEQLTRQREENRIRKEEEAKKVLSLANKGVAGDAEFEFSDADRETALAKLTTAAKKYDPNHPSAQALHGFERNAMQPAEFKELVRRTFNLRLTSPEVGAIFKIFDESDAEYPLPSDQIDCGDFLKYFMSLGFAERAQIFREQLERQRRENKEREEEHRRKVEALATRGTFTVDMQFTEADKESIMEKVNKAAFGFDKTHPAAPSLEAFEVSHMPPGLFRENLKRVFHIHASPKEIGYLMSIFDKDKVGKVDSKEFMLKFQDIGKKARAKKHSEFLDSKRAAAKAMKREAEEKLAAQYAKAELQVDYDCSSDDYNSAIAKLTESSTKYDKTHPSAPSLDGFTGGAISPGVFRELLRRAFNVWLAPKELGAIVSRYRHESDPNLIDGKQFLIAFMKLGFDARAVAKAQTLEKQRKAAKDRKLEEELKLHLSAQRVVLKVEDGFTTADLEAAMVKLRTAAMKYDKNAPGCVSMEAFDAAFLTPGMFREVIKRTANIVFEPKELAAVLKEFDNGHGNVDSRRFLVQFIHWGSEERDKVKAIQLDKQRKQNFLRKTEHERKMKEAEDKMIIEVNYDYTPEERDSAFQKLTVAAKKYDKGHPGAMALDGFEEQFLKAHVFREMLKRTFGVILTSGELGAVMHYFDKKKSGTVQSKKFLIYFLKVGIAEREQDHRTSLAKLRKDEEMREREHTEKLAAQWAKIELNLTDKFSPEEKESAMEKLADAAMKFDPASPGPMGLTAFEASVLSPAVFREMLKRSFNMMVTPGELAALVAEFDKTGKKAINCKEFMVRFTTLGFERRSLRKAAQLEKQRLMDIQAQEEAKAKLEKVSTKLDFVLENAYSDEDLHSALEKIRVIASNYDRAHASAPSLQGFMGTNMKPHEFKDMLNRTFHVALTAKELTALTSYFPAESGMKKEEDAGDGSERPKSAKAPDVRIHNQHFLNYFNKIQREEQNKRRRARIQKERELMQKEAEYKESLIKEKQQYEFSLLENTPDDELTMLSKIREAAQEYAIDPSLYNELMQGFKGPALPPNKFQELFRQIFSIRLTFPELGVLLGILDISGIGTFDGGRFLNWFYKISRIEEKIMLGHSNDEVTMDTLRLNVRRPHPSTNTAGSAALSRSKIGTAASGASAALTDASVPTTKSVGALTTTSSQPAKSVSSTAVQPSSSKPATAVSKPTAPSAAPPAASKAASTVSPPKGKHRYPYNFSEAEEDEDEHDLEPSSASAAFSKSTLKQSWFLPSLTSAPPTTIYANNSSISTHPSTVSNSGDDFQYLKSIFDASMETSGSLLHSSSMNTINSIDRRASQHVVEKLIGPANQQPRAFGKSKTSSLSNVAVYGGLSASGEVPAVLAVTKPIRNIQTAPVTTTGKRRPLSPVSDQLLLAPAASIDLNRSMELKQQKHLDELKEQKLAQKQNTGIKPKAVVRPIKSKKFAKPVSGGPITPQVTELIIPQNNHEKEVEFLSTLFSPQDMSGLISDQPSQFNASTVTSNTAGGPLANNSESLLAKLDQLTQQMAKRPRKKVYLKPSRVDQSIEPVAVPTNPKPSVKSLSDSINNGTFFFPSSLSFAESVDSKSPKDKKDTQPPNEEDLYDDDGELIVQPAAPAAAAAAVPADEVDERGHEFDGPLNASTVSENKKPSTVLKGAPTIKKTGLLLVPKNKSGDVAMDEATAKESVDVLRQIMTSTVY